MPEFVNHGNSIVPPGLKKGDTIGIVAPASHFKEEPFREGVALLEEMGYRVVFHSELYSKKRYLAGEDEQRAWMINDFFENPEIGAILCARGGYGSIRTLPHIDFERIRNNPKIFMGFSDITALLLSIHQRAGLVTFHGPTVASLGEVTPETLDALFRVCSSQEGLILKAGQVLKDGSARGVLMGGNLCTINHMLGTPYEPDFDNKILLLEDVGEAPYKIDRILFQMKLAGCFDSIRGLVLGTFEDCGDYKEICEIVMETVGDIQIPVLAGLGVGHGEINFTVPMGGDAVLDTRNRTLRAGLNFLEF